MYAPHSARVCDPLAWTGRYRGPYSPSLVQAASLRAVDEPQPAADFQLSDLDGQLLRLQDQRGKVVLLNFWATWCHPCLQEMPLMEQLYQTLQQRPFVMWAVAMKEDRDEGLRSWTNTTSSSRLCWTAMVPSVPAINSAACRQRT